MTIHELLKYTYSFCELIGMGEPMGMTSTNLEIIGQLPRSIDNSTSGRLPQTSQQQS